MRYDCQCNKSIESQHLGTNWFFVTSPADCGEAFECFRSKWRRVCLGGIPFGMSFENKSLFKKVIALPIIGDISETCISFIWDLFVAIYQGLFVE